jgi:hypothetical protein
MEKAILSSQATSTNRICELEKQVASITTELHHMRQQQNAIPAPNKPSSNNPKRGRSSVHAPTQCAGTPAAPHLHKPTTDDLTWATRITVAAENNEKPFTTVSHKKKKPALLPLIPKSLPRIEREIIIPTDTTFPPAELQKWADHALNCLNNFIHYTVEITHLPFALARINSHNKIVLMTNPAIPASAYTPYMPMLLNEIKSLKPTTANANSCWTKFLVHNIPLGTTTADLKVVLEANYPTLQLMQEPRWLVPPERRLNKRASTVVISLQGTLDLKRLGTNTLVLANRKCRITEYFSWTPTSHCHNCQGYGHHTKLCKAEKPTCTICAQQYSTKDHLCPILTCRAGKSCTYPPLKCTACGTSHKATDPLYPVHIQHRTASCNKAPAPEQDEPMEPQL